MSPIPKIDNIETPYVSNIYRIPSNDLYINNIPNIHPPVTLDIGFPIVEIPGCVWKHQDDRRSYSSVDPWDKNLVENDPDGAGTLCPSGSMPYFYPMNFEPERRLPTIIAKRGEPPPPPPTPDTSEVVKPDEDVECPGPNSPRIGDVAQNKTERVSGFELSDDGKICIVLSSFNSNPETLSVLFCATSPILGALGPGHSTSSSGLTTLLVSGDGGGGGGSPLFATIVSKTLSGSKFIGWKNGTEPSGHNVTA